MYEVDFDNADLSRSPLSGLRVVETPGTVGSYAGRLLADLGADVILVVPDGANLPDEHDPEAQSEWVFYNAGKTITSVAPHQLAQGLREELGRATILITSEGPDELARLGLSPKELNENFPHLVHIAVSPFGQTGPWADRPATDLTLLAAGGLLALAGEPDQSPVRAAGSQSVIATGLHAAVGGLIATLVRMENGDGQLVDVSAQEAIAHSLENAAQFVDLEGISRSRVGGAPKEAGTGLFACADGWVYLVTSLGGQPLGWDGFIQWMQDEGRPDLASTFASDCWSDPAWRLSAEAIGTFRALFEEVAVSLTKGELTSRGQSRGVSISPVSTPEDLLRNPHLLARGFFTEIQADGKSFTLPGSPYRFSGQLVRPSNISRSVFELASRS